MNFFSCVELEMSQASKVLKEAGQLNVLNGVTGNDKVVLLTGATAGLTLQRSDSGKLFVFDTTTATTVVLPSLADAGPGWNARFIVNQVAGASNHVVKENIASDTDVIYGMVVEADISTDAATAAGVTNIQLTSAAGAVGDMVEVIATSTKWFVRGYGSADGSITFS